MIQEELIRVEEKLNKLINENDDETEDDQTEEVVKSKQEQEKDDHLTNEEVEKEEVEEEADKKLEELIMTDDDDEGDDNQELQEQQEIEDEFTGTEILEWVNEIAEEFNLKDAHDFSESFADGHLLSAIIAHFEPDLMDMDNLDMTDKEVVDEALDIIRELDIKTELTTKEVLEGTNEEAMFELLIDLTKLLD